MAIPDYDTYVARLDGPMNRLTSFKPNQAITVGRVNSFWTLAPESGVAPTTPAVPTNNTRGAIGTLATNQPGYIDGTNVRLLDFCSNNASPMKGGAFQIYDRLSHMGGLDATVITPGTTTNLPTAALTRYTTGEGVQMMVEIYTQIGTTATTITVTYTNQAGTGGRVSPLTAIGGTGLREAGRVMFLPLQAGDTGVRSIESYTLTASTTTAGAFGFTLIKPLAIFPAAGVEQGSVSALFTCGNMPIIENAACLAVLFTGPNTGTGAMIYELTLAED